MFILKGTKAAVSTHNDEKELVVASNCYASKGDYIALDDGWEYVFEEFDGEMVFVRP